MHNNTRLIIVAAVFLLLAAGSATANTVVVETGPGPSDPFADSLIVSDSQWLAGRFSVAQPTMLHTIQGWIAWDGQDSHEMRVSLYNDVAGLPSSSFYSDIFSVTETLPGFYGLSSPSPLVTLDAGTYWVSFESDDFFSGYSMLIPALGGSVPFLQTALYDGSGWSSSLDPLGIGAYLEGSPVPEPGSMVLLGTGLAGIAVAWSSRRKQQNGA